MSIDELPAHLVRNWEEMRERLLTGAYQPQPVREWRCRRAAPQGGPLSPLLANALLDEVDRELEKRGLSFVRYADDQNV